MSLVSVKILSVDVNHTRGKTLSVDSGMFHIANRWKN